MEIDKSKIKTQDELDEPAPADQAADRVEAQLKLIESEAKEKVADGLQDEALAREAERLKKEADSELKSLDQTAKKTES